MWDDDSIEKVLAKIGEGYEDPYENEPEFQFATSFVSEFTNLLRYTRQLSESESGQIIVGQYALLEKIGEGGMGDVYRARHLHLQKEVALKILSKRRTQDFHSLSQFKNEILSAGRISHPGIVSATDAGEDRGIQYLVMEYVEGFDLGKLLDQNRPAVSTEEAAAIAYQVATGLSYLHDQQMIHGDIKPSNIMLTSSGETKLLDLGLTRQSIKQSIAGNDDLNEPIAGTLAFLAPEYGETATRIDIRADLFSLGATLYMLVTGRPIRPCHNLSTESIREFISEPVRVDAKIPEKLRTVLIRLLETDPALRYQTPTDLITELEPLAEHADLKRLYNREVQQLMVQTEPFFEQQLPTILKPIPPAEVSRPAPDNLGQKKSGYLVAVLIIVIGLAIGLAIPDTNQQQARQSSVIDVPPAVTDSTAKTETVNDTWGDDRELLTRLWEVRDTDQNISIRIEIAGEQQQITALQQLPQEPCELLEIGQMARKVRLNRSQLKLLPQFRKLRFLYLKGDSFSTDTYHRFGGIRRLQRLHIASDTLPDDVEFWRQLSTCDYFYDFAFHATSESTLTISLQFLESLSECKYLRSVELGGSLSFHKLSECPLGRLSDLYDLNLTGGGISHEFISGLEQIGQLKQLSLQTNQLNPKSLDFLTLGTSLQILSLTGSNKIDDRILTDFLREQTDLYQLQLTGFPNITSEVLSRFSNYRQLYRLSLIDCPKIGKDLHQLPALKSLGRIEFVNCGLTSDQLEAFKVQPNLKWLNLSFNSLSSFELNQLRKELPRTAVFSADE